MTAWLGPAGAIALPALGALLIALLGRWPNLREGATLLTAALLFGLVIGLLPDVLASESERVVLLTTLPGVALTLQVEPLGMLFALVASGLWIVNSIYSIGYMRANREAHQTRFYVCFAIALAATMGVAFAGNLGALAAGQRYLDRDLNRMWRERTLGRVRAGERETREDHELAALDAALDAALGEPHGRVFLLDLHTTSGAGPAFAVLDDSLPNRRFALAFPVPLVLGLEEELVGTLVFDLSARGVTALAFEGGRHDDPASVDRCEAAVWIALDAAGVLPRGLRARAEAGRRLLRASRGETPQLVEVLYRHRITRDDRFRMRPGFASFDAVAVGQPLATDRAGDVASPYDGRLLMPLYQSLGDDGFFVARPVPRFWFELSATLRRLRADRALALLPGISRHPRVADSYVVHRRVARWLVRDLFHLLGFRRLDSGPQHVVYTRRPEGL